MAARLAWGITGAGHYLKETFDVVRNLSEAPDILVTTFLTRAGVEVVRAYGLWDDLKEVSRVGYYQEVFTDEDQGASSFKAGRLFRGMYSALLVSPATANTVAKIVHGIADSLVTNTVAEAQRGSVPVFILPTDLREEIVETTYPSRRDADQSSTGQSGKAMQGEGVRAKVRALDARNAELLQAMEGITVLKHPSEIEDKLRPLLSKRADDSAH
jgi:dihydromethanopterin reductase (acceptor)